MFNHKLAALAIAVPAALFATAATASDTGVSAFDQISVGAGVSTLGYGMDVNARLSKRFSATLGYSTFKFDGDEQTDEVNYEGQLKSSNTSLKLNWHPFAGGFHVAVGAVVGDINAAVTGTPRAGGSYQFNGVTYTAQDVGSLSGRVEIKDSFAPYAGIGYRSRGKIGFYADLGVISAKTSVHLAATGLAGDERFASDLEAERRELEDSVDLSLYPVIGAGLIYRF